MSTKLSDAWPHVKDLLAKQNATINARNTTIDGLNAEVATLKAELAKATTPDPADTAALAEISKLVAANTPAADATATQPANPAVATFTK